MNRQKHFVNLFLGTGLNIVLGVVTTPIITRLVSPDSYGALSLFTMYGSIFLVFILLGQDFSYNRFYYRYEEKEYKRYILRLTAKWPIIISLIIGVSCIGYYIISSEKEKIILIFGLYIVCLVMDRFSNLTLRLDMKTTVYSLNLNLNKIIYTALVIFAVICTDLDHVLVLTSCTLIAQTVSCIVGIIFERNLWFGNNEKNFDENKYYSEINFRTTWKYGWPFIFQSLCAWLFTGADKLMIQMFSNNTQLGLYASALSVINIFNVITTTFTTIWAPMAVEEYEKNNGSTTFFIKAADYISIVLFAAGASVLLFKDVLVFLLGPEYREAAFLIPFLSMYPILYTISESTVYGINFTQKTYLHIVITASCGILNVVLNYFLINYVGALGAAIATGITYTVLLILRTYFSVKCFPVKYHSAKLGIMLIIYYIFAIYSSFNKTTWISVILFMMFALVSVILYKNSIKELLYMCINFIRLTLKKLRKLI